MNEAELSSGDARCWAPIGRDPTNESEDENVTKDKYVDGNEERGVKSLEKKHLSPRGKIRLKCKSSYGVVCVREIHASL